MPEYLHPGVYVEEVSSGVRPIEGVSTSTAGFVGVTAKGIPNRAIFLTRWEDFTRNFGDIYPESLLPYAVAQFFENGGQRCYVVRVLNALSAATGFLQIPSRETALPSRNTLRIEARGAGAWGNSLQVLVEDAAEDPSAQFRIAVLLGGREVETHEGLSMDPAADNYVVSMVNDASQFIVVRDLEAFQDPTAANRRASWTSTAALADPVPVAGLTFVVDADTGSVTVTVPAAPAGGPARDDLVAMLNVQLVPLGIVASLDATNRLRLVHGSSGYDRYLRVSGTATTGAALAGPTALMRGSGRAIGATVRSSSQPTFTTAAGSNTLTFSVGVPGTMDNFDVTLANGNLTAAAVASALDTEFRAPNRRGILTARAEGNQVVIATTNRGGPDARLTITGNAAPVFDFRPFDRTQPATDVPGVGRQEAAFLQSAPGPFSVATNANFRLRVNNGALGADSADIVINFVVGPAFTNLAQVTAGQLAAAINTAAGGLVQASVENRRVVVRQARRGPYYTLRLIDGLHSPNARIKFQAPPPSPDASPALAAGASSGYAEGDVTSPYLRPALNPDAAGINQPRPLAGGDDGVPVSDFDYIGTADDRTGLHALDPINDVSFIAIPGHSSPGVVNAAVGYCATRKDCVFIADAPSGLDAPGVQAYLFNQITAKESYGALYYPWVQVADPVGRGRNPRRFVPPSGFVAGMYARIDNTRGVWKAPAGTEATLRGAVLDLETRLSDADQDILNPYGVNALRRFAGAGIVIWGARTLASVRDPEWRYLPIRRLAIYLERSIYNGTQWAVFEPNDKPLWDALQANIEDFMMGAFRAGAFAGRTPEEAFAVRCDEALNPESERNAGRVHMEVKFAPLRPAEFVIIRISQKTQRPAS